MMSEAMDRDLSLSERFGLRLHLLLCHGCRNASRQLAFIRRACAEWVRRDD